MFDCLDAPRSCGRQGRDIGGSGRRRASSPVDRTARACMVARRAGGGAKGRLAGRRVREHGVVVAGTVPPHARVRGRERVAGSCAGAPAARVRSVRERGDLAYTCPSHRAGGNAGTRRGAGRGRSDTRGGRRNHLAEAVARLRQHVTDALDGDDGAAARQRTARTTAPPRLTDPRWHGGDRRDARRRRRRDRHQRPRSSHGSRTRRW